MTLDPKKKPGVSPLDHELGQITLTDENGAQYTLTKGSGSSILATNINDPNDIWYASNSAKVDLRWISNVIDYDHYSNDQHAFLISLSIAAGNIYRLLLGTSQPIMKIARDKASSNTPAECWRLSKKVDRFIDWDACMKSNEIVSEMSGDEGEDEKQIIMTLYHYPLDSEKCTLVINNKDIPIKKLIALFVSGLFLGDTDFNAGNFGFVIGDSQLTAIKLDPELSFSSQFGTTSTEDIFYQERLFHKYADDLVLDYEETKEALYDFFTNPIAEKEKIEMVNIIASTNLKDITEILTSIIDTDKTAKLKGDLIKQMHTRHAMFQMLANRLSSSQTSLAKNYSSSFPPLRENVKKGFDELDSNETSEPKSKRQKINKQI